MNGRPSRVFQEHPYIFTKVNSLPRSNTTVKPLTPDCTDSVPIWLTAVLAVTGLLTGWAVTWLFLCCRAKRSRKVMTAAAEMKGTEF